MQTNRMFFHESLILLDRSMHVGSRERTVVFHAYRVHRSYNDMLKPLLLLCCAAIFVSAGDQKEDASVSNNLAGDHAASQPELSSADSSKHIMLSSKLTHVSPVPTESLMNPLKSSNLNTKSNGSAVTTLDESDHPSKISDTTIPPTPPTTPPTTTSTTSTKTPPTTPTTTSTTPSTTTPTTTTPPTTTTTTTTPVPSTPAPTPVPPPSTQKWSVNQNNTICIIVQMAAQFNINYTKDNVVIHKIMDIPSGNISNVTGMCGKDEQILTVSWETQKGVNDSFTLHFLKNETQKQYSLHHFEISLAPQEFPAAKLNDSVILKHKTPQYDTALSNSYRCLKQQKLDLYVEGKKESVGQLTLTNLQFQAFRSDNATVFGLAKDCAFDTPDIVPITVGCALAGLVVIVLFAYLVGRRRSQARGYLSM